jgi:hypothetical protein
MMPYYPATVDRWRNEGLPVSVQTQADFHEYFGLTPLDFFFAFPDIDGTACREKIVTPDDFAAVKDGVYDLEKIRIRMDEYKDMHNRMQEKDGILWVPLHGFFWHPRDLFGIAEHFMMLYDEPELIHEINKAVLEFNISTVRMMNEIGTPSIICVSEDIAYKLGSMVSKEMFDEFMAPYHRELLVEIKKTGAVAALDSDGEISAVTSWFNEIGYDCINPLERQTEMDLMKFREDNQEIAFLGGYNKIEMSKGAEAIEQEFESLKPLFKKGKFIPAVDHQTPPEVSLENYRHYLKASERFFTEMGV